MRKIIFIALLCFASCAKKEYTQQELLQQGQWTITSIQTLTGIVVHQAPVLPEFFISFLPTGGITKHMGGEYYMLDDSTMKIIMGLDTNYHLYPPWFDTINVRFNKVQEVKIKFNSYSKFEMKTPKEKIYFELF